MAETPERDEETMITVPVAALASATHGLGAYLVFAAEKPYLADEVARLTPIYEQLKTTLRAGRWAPDEP